MSLRIGLAQWHVGEPRTAEEFTGRIASAVDTAAREGVQLAVFPEYLALELAAIFTDPVRRDFALSLRALQDRHQEWLTFFAAQARRHGMHILAGTFLLCLPNGRFRNRAYFFAPDGSMRFQDKLTLTGFERDSGVIEPGDELRVFDTAHGRIAVGVCYDSEFPLYARAQVEAGARLLLVPSCTDTPAGATRVRSSCLARALENQIAVAQSVTAGVAAWSPALDSNTGTAAIYVPSDRGWPADGVLAAAEDGASWLIADIDMDALDAARSQGQVANRNDWEAQRRPCVLRARIT
jgi:predicted amidohydrolase